MAKKASIVRVHILIVFLGLSIFLFIRYRWPGQKPLPDGFIISEFHKLYHTTYQVHQKTNWFGIKIQQTPTDMWAIQEILTELKPDFVIETGTLKGGSALYFATLFHAIKDTGRVVTVNIEKQVDAAETFPVFQEHVIQIIGDSVGTKTIERLYEIVKGQPALVMLDSDHHKEHVLKEMRLYSQFVPIGGYP